MKFTKKTRMYIHPHWKGGLLFWYYGEDDGKSGIFPEYGCLTMYDLGQKVFAGSWSRYHAINHFMMEKWKFAGLMEFKPR